MRGTIAEITSSGIAVVRLDSSNENNSACHTCDVKSACSLLQTELLELPLSAIPFVVAPNDCINIEYNSRERICVISLVYLLPLIFMMILGGAGYCISEAASIIMAFSGLAIGLAVNIVVNRKYSTKRLFHIERC